MYIDRMLAPITTLGPGRRLVIWTRGCHKKCKNCANPELWSIEGAKNYPVKEIIQIARNIICSEQITGITISGGDPLEQKEDLLQLLQALSVVSNDILVYTGFTFHEIESLWNNDEINSLKDTVSVLIDGPYIEAQNSASSVLRGSSNQKIYYFKPEFESIYTEYMEKGRQIQNVYMGSKLISVGIHNRKGD